MILFCNLSLFDNGFPLNHSFTFTDGGQDSQEDADACLSLMRWKVHEGVIKNIKRKITLLKSKIRALAPEVESPTIRYEQLY